MRTVESIRGSSNGRTAAFDVVNLGSTPSPRTAKEMERHS